MSEIITTQLECGAVLVVEPVASVASVALSWLLPVGSATDPPRGDGMAALLSELIFRGAGGLNSRQHSDALDRLGVQRSSGVLTHHLRLGATLLGDHLDEALPLLTAMVRNPSLPPDAMEAVRSLCLQTLDSLEDEPQHLVMLRLRQRHRPAPFNRHGYGCRQLVEDCSIEALREAWTNRCVPPGSIFSAAGAVDPSALARRLDELLTGWSGDHRPPVELAPPLGGQSHVQRDTAQMHLAVAYDAPCEADPRSMLERLSVSVLSGGTSARLFTEVRQKRSLCYSVGASLYAGRDKGMVSLYAGTTPQRAQETLDVCLAEIKRMSAGVTPQEFQRAVIGLKSHLIMHGESTPARASALGVDQFRLGRARTLDELAREIDAISIDDLNAYLKSRQFGDFTVASIGKVELLVNAP